MILWQLLKPFLVMREKAAASNPRFLRRNHVPITATWGSQWTRDVHAVTHEKLEEGCEMILPGVRRAVI
jgi:hypothetical protein